MTFKNADKIEKLSPQDVPWNFTSKKKPRKEMKKKYRKMLEEAEEKQFSYSGAWVAHQESVWHEVQRLIKEDEENGQNRFQRR